MDINQISRYLIIAGVALIATGLIFWAVNKFVSLRNMTGNVTFNIGGMTCIIPILASVILSIVLTVILNLVARFLINRKSYRF